MAALDVRTGEVLTEAIRRSDAVTFTAFLDRLDRVIDPGKEIHVVLDNGSSEQHWSPGTASVGWSGHDADRRPTPRRGRVASVGGERAEAATARPEPLRTPPSARSAMSLSIRNQLPGTVTSVTAGPAMATVRARLAGGRTITAAITTDASTDLGLTPGTPVHAVVKATEVALATGAVDGLSIRNQLPGTVTSVTPGAAMATVKVAVDGGELTAAITAQAASDLGLAPGTAVVALIKATDVSLSTD